MKEKADKNTNSLIHESSPYLLQHAHNPVDWHPWNEQTLQKAKQENKPLLVSIGYSACHWCHVMEHESFEDIVVAKAMNENFICVKVDREERPDVDQVYMDAVQAISGRGGWPLNCFALPNGKPFWGGTYFPKDQWMSVLDQIKNLYKNQKHMLEKQAAEIETGLQENSWIDISSGKPTFSKIESKTMAEQIATRFDHEHGGTSGAPKFPMPNIYQYLLRYWYHSKDTSILDHVLKTLDEMASGGIYDQLGGGFARYSVDSRWHVPHFEKMLYDNAQLVSLYSEAYQITKKPLYEKVIRESLEFITRELTSAEGGFYAALDADSEGEEGKFYVWTEKEFNEILGIDAPMAKDYFGIGGKALWEDGKNVLVRNLDKVQIAEKYAVSETMVEEKIEFTKQKLLEHRSHRVRPGLDDKILTSWNALMLKALTNAYRALGESSYLSLAIQNANFITNTQMHDNGFLFRNFKNGKSTIPGFLDDYSFTIEALIGLYEVTFDELWLQKAKVLADYAIEHFYDQNTAMFFYSSDVHNDVVTRKTEVTDNVIPASCSSLAKGLHALGLLFEKQDYIQKSEKMLQAVQQKMLRFPASFTNWGIVLLQKTYPYHTFVISGPQALSKQKELLPQFKPNILLAGSESYSKLSLFADRWDVSKTQIYVCTGSECQLPVTELNEALQQIDQVS